MWSPHSHSDQYDQELDTLLVGPIPVGVNKFIFEAKAPDTSRIPDADILGVTVILLTCAYDGREFVRVGYYVNNEYDSDDLKDNPPAKPIIERVQRNLLAEKPRVTRFAIKWYVLPRCVGSCVIELGFLSLCVFFNVIRAPAHPHHIILTLLQGLGS